MRNNELKAAIVTQTAYSHESVYRQLSNRSDRLLAAADSLVKNSVFGSLPHRGAEILGSYAYEAGFKPYPVSLHDKRAADKARDADLVILSVMDIGLDRAAELVGEIGPNNHTLVGGYGMITPENWQPLLEKYPWLTIFPGRRIPGGLYKIGEAEGVLSQALDDLKSKARMEPTYVRETAYNLEDVGQEPYLDPEVWNTVKKLFGKRRKVKSIEASRGCSQGCDFCPTAKQTISVKPIDVLLKEIELLEVKPSDVLFFTDQNLMNLPPDYLQELFTHINQKGIRWVGEGTITSLLRQGNGYDQVIQTMSKNCLTFLVGVEDLGHVTRGSGLKSELAHNSSFDELVRKTRELGLPMLYSLIFGTDFQEPGYGEYAAQRVLETGISAAAHIATPRPGTPYWDRLKHEGRLLPQSDQSEFRNMRFYIVHEPAQMDPEQVMREFMLFQKMVYDPRRIGEKFIRNLKVGGNYAQGLLVSDSVYYLSTLIFGKLYPEAAKWADAEMDRKKI